MSNFTGKVALVTGAAHGIGKAIAEKFAKAGANTVIVDFNYELGTETAEQITRDYQQQSIFIQADVSNAKDMEKVREETFKQFGRIDILVLNAGVAFANKVNDISYEEWQKTLDINLSGLFNTVKPFYNDFLTNKGSIVYISSGSALSGTGGGVSYPASKAGGEGLMRGLAKELGPKGVNVNSIAPRLIDSGKMMRVNYPTQESLDAVLEKIPVRRLGTVEDVANLTLFLADKDNSYIQGQTILLDGGRTIA
ncbi:MULTISPECIES: SDR family NAD(P)-dependent oxidoreductase [Gilliamella]|uniref:SDR family oxidoreductase n=1 Tax=Gilliamella apicola TaxID=1196095 RepID=A0A556SWM6_9GAMM|nr:MULTISPECIES: SDR family NAD(P)-dependent oxidoreductase [Gilliamella]KES19166.1 Dehydrogenase with different specificity (related to short-chain alcohol dehydrogenases) [Gilliamella apicola SCGC AB-598-B02]MBI0027429.1 SDR family oxidoreductase [Gilliamella sp. B14448G7]MBI0035557.1 SDR family oxidoreductase [Gilliamella sp. B14448G11]MBI0041253.1 SDR family oxidoreductase [Gilliamella sp. B14448G12]MBI0093887.1 SDR family oxidoreductase [Gilliamella sp. W8136]